MTKHKKGRMTKQRQFRVLVILAVSFGGAGFMFLPQPNVIHAQTREEVVLWESIKDSNRIDDFRVYLKTYPQGVFSPLARSRAGELMGIEKISIHTSPQLYDYKATGNVCYPTPPSQSSLDSASDFYGYIEFSNTPSVPHHWKRFGYKLESPLGKVYHAGAWKASSWGDNQSIFCAVIPLKDLITLYRSEGEVRGSWRFTVFADEIDLEEFSFTLK